MYPLTARKGRPSPGGKGREKLRYIGGDSLVHRLDPRTKLFVLLAVSCGALLVTDMTPALAIFGLLLAFASLSGAMRHWLKMLLRISPVFILIMVFNAFFPHIFWGPVLLEARIWNFHPFLTPGGILYGVAMGLRFAAVTGASFLFVMTTRFEDFVAGLRKLGVPYILAFSLGLGLRSVTLLSADMRAIMDAQRSRCMELDAGMLHYDRLLPLAMPMIICLIDRSKNISSAMLCRGYGFTDRPGLYTRIRMNNTDWLVVAVIAFMGLGYLVLKIIG